ncbi:MAG: hypothetical protein JXQ30_11685, partial [Spirochaetes bacterium]|nr:hypothetical protein [Spirochaetota bacterium]
LLAMRSTILVTCQSFLVVPYSILNTAASFRSVIVPTYIVAVLGIFVALILLEPINAAHRTIGKWLVKQRTLLKGSKGLADLAIDRDMIPGTEADSQKDTDHERSLLFSKFGPWAFIVFWIACIVWTTVRIVLGF